LFKGRQTLSVINNAGTALQGVPLMLNLFSQTNVKFPDQGKGTTAVTWFEYALSVPVEETAVVT